MHPTMATLGRAGTRTSAELQPLYNGRVPAAARPGRAPGDGQGRPPSGAHDLRADRAGTTSSSTVTELLSTPVRSTTQYEAGLSLIAGLARTTPSPRSSCAAATSARDRPDAVDPPADQQPELPRLFWIEAEYRTQREAELEWTASRRRSQATRSKASSSGGYLQAADPKGDEQTGPGMQMREHPAPNLHPEVVRERTGTRGASSWPGPAPGDRPRSITTQERAHPCRTDQQKDRRQDPRQGSAAIDVHDLDKTYPGDICPPRQPHGGAGHRLRPSSARAGRQVRQGAHHTVPVRLGRRSSAGCDVRRDPIGVRQAHRRRRPEGGDRPRPLAPNLRLQGELRPPGAGAAPTDGRLLDRFG
jgi:hypothetical protein